MKKTLLLVFAVLFSISATNAQNLILNGDFETNGKEHWEGYNNGIVTAESDESNGTNNCYEGTTSGRVNNGEGSLLQDVTVEPGASYTLSFVGRMRDQDNSFSPSVRDKGGDNAILNEVVVDSDTWVEYSVEFTAVSDLVRVVFYKGKGVSPFYLDNVELVKNNATNIKSLNSLESNTVKIYQSASGEFIVNSTNDISSLSVFTTGGQLVKQMANKGASEVTFNLNGQPQGLYILRIEDVQGNVSVKKVLNN